MAQTKWANELEKQVKACIQAEDPAEGVKALKDFMDSTTSYKDFPVDMKQAYSILSDVSNNLSGEKERMRVLAEEFQRDHRTLQQSIMKLFFSLIVAVASWPEYSFDGRNEKMGRLCRTVVDLIKQYNEAHPDEPAIDWLPLI